MHMERLVPGCLLPGQLIAKSSPFIPPARLCQVSPTGHHSHRQGTCPSGQNGNAQTINQDLSSFIHLFCNRNDSEPKMPTSLFVWVQTVQMASVFMMSISGLALRR